MPTSLKLIHMIGLPESTFYLTLNSSLNPDPNPDSNPNPDPNTSLNRNPNPNTSLNPNLTNYNGAPNQS